MLPHGFIQYTKEQSQKLGLNHKIIKLNFLEDEIFTNNCKERCFECRKRMYSSIQKLPEFYRYEYFIEGTNLTDLLENRPGVLVKEMFNKTSPLVKCEITKQDVFEMIEFFDLDYSHDTTCLATRIQTNRKVSQKKLKLINDAENLVKKYVKQNNVRVRYVDQSAVITVDDPLEIL